MSFIKPYKFSHFFEEFTQSLQMLSTILEEKNIEYLNLIEPDNGKYKLVYNTEQLSREYMLNKVAELSRLYPIFDYSSANIEYIKKINSNAKCILYPILFNRNLMIFDKPEKYEFDVIFIGSVTDRRHKIIKDLVNKGISVYVMTCCYDYKLKHEMILKSKVLINIHAENDYKVFEFARCSIPIFNGCVVVSEDSLIECESEINKYVTSQVVFANYDKLCDKTAEILQNFDRYKSTVDYNLLEKLTTIDCDRLKHEINNLK